jgi:hypothetical protein
MREPHVFQFMKNTSNSLFQPAINYQGKVSFLLPESPFSKGKGHKRPTFDAGIICYN